MSLVHVRQTIPVLGSVLKVTVPQPSPRSPSRNCYADGKHRIFYGKMSPVGRRADIAPDTSVFSHHYHMLTAFNFGVYDYTTDIEIHSKTRCEEYPKANCQCSVHSTLIVHFMVIIPNHTLGRCIWQGRIFIINRRMPYRFITHQKDRGYRIPLFDQQFSGQDPVRA